jgi:hypothetical protein
MGEVGFVLRLRVTGTAQDTSFPQFIVQELVTGLTRQPTSEIQTGFVEWIDAQEYSSMS